MNTTTTHLVTRAARSKVTHASKHGEQTLCGRNITPAWSTEPLTGAEQLTCDACRVWMGPTLTEQRRAAAPCMFRPGHAGPCAAGVPQADELCSGQLEDLPVDRTPLTLLVVPCSGKKLDRPAPARELYRGTLTTMGLAATDVIVGDPYTLTGHAGCRTMILSALHGLVDPAQVLAPYDVRMGDPDSIATAALAQQLVATGATRVVALTPSAYTGALRAACELAGVELVAAFEGLRGIGEQRGLLAQLRRSGGYGPEHRQLLQLETRRTAQDHADALAEDRARTADAAQQLVHLMDDSLLSLCGARGPVNGWLQVTPVLADVTCPDCRVMLPGWLNQQHSEALRENAMHDAAMEKAQDLSPQLLEQLTAPPTPQRLPQTLRTRTHHQRTLRLVFGGARA